MPPTSRSSPMPKKEARCYHLAVMLLLLVWTFCFGSAILGEEPLPDEALLESEEEQFDPQEVLERLQELRQRPLDPNQASFSELEQIPYLSVLQIKAIIEARQDGKFRELNDLLRAQGIDVQTLARVRSFLRIRPPRGVRGHLRSRVAWTLPLSRGYREGHYWGDATRAYVRLHLLAGDHLWAGVLAEKDPGEPDLADYRSAFLQLEGMGPVKKLLLGDFALEFGQGLALWTCGGAWGGIQDGSDLVRKGRGIRPYSSTEENTALRGAAISGDLGPLTLDLFGSRARLDATLEDEAARSLLAGGLHRTVGEIEKKDALEETLLGGHLGLRVTGDTGLGLTWYRTHYHPPLRPDDVVRKRYALCGSRHEILGGDVDAVLGPVQLFGEVATGSNRSLALMAGVAMVFGSMRAGLTWRQYPADFQNPRGAAPAAKEDQNENGLLAVLRWKVGRRTRLELMADGFHRPWRTYSLEMPSTGESWSIQAVQGFCNNIELSIRLRAKRDDVPSEIVDGFSKIGQRHRCGRRFQMDWQVSPGVQLRTRWETSRVSFRGRESVERGSLLLAHGRISRDNRVGLRASVALFRVSSYDGRIYLCEVGPSGVARNVALFGRGSRAFLLLDARILEVLQASLKFCFTRYDHCRSMGSGWDLIDDNVQREIMFQLDWNW